MLLCNLTKVDLIWNRWRCDDDDDSIAIMVHTSLHTVALGFILIVLVLGLVEYIFFVFFLFDSSIIRLCRYVMC